MEYLELIGKYLTEESTPQENESLLSWINSSPENKHEFIETCKIWHATKNCKTSFDYIKAYNAFSTKIQNTELVTKETKVVSLHSGKSKNLWKMIAIPVAAAMILTAGLLYLFRPTTELRTFANKTNSIETVKLPDGSVAYLNKTASLTVPTEFSGNTRPVSMQGEIFFDISKNKAKPFIISVGNASITVKGTSFNVSYDKGKGKCNVIVNTGTVVLAAENKNMVTLTKAEKGTVDLKTNQVGESINDDINFLSWKTGILIFKNSNYKEVFKDIERHYAITIKYPSDIDSKLALTATFDHEDLNSTLKVIELMFNVKIDKQNSIFVVRK